MASLILLQEGSTGQAFPLGPGGYAVGRGESNSLQLADESLAEEHATIEMGEGSFILKDLGSATGTYVNGERVTETTLHHRDIIRFGAYRFVFQELDPEPDLRAAAATSKIDLPPQSRPRASGPIRAVAVVADSRPRSLNTRATARLDEPGTGHPSGPIRAVRREKRPAPPEVEEGPAAGDHFAKVSFFCGLAGIVAFLPAIYFGHAANPRTPAGRTHRIAGLALGYAWLAAWIGFGLFLLLGR